MSGAQAADAVLELLVQGPDFETSRALKPGEPEVVLGRDADCGVSLPDPQRNVSRRHLAVWNERGELHFRVLSVVNGVEMPFGEAPPGARGVLPAGQFLKLAEYSLSVTVTVTAAAPDSASPPDTDPWAVFDRDGSDVAAIPEEDPFGDWGFETTFGPGSAALQASQLGLAADLGPFFRGLGLDPAQVGPLSEGELHVMGQVVRNAVAGLLELRRATAGVTQELRAEDRTMMAAQDNNPLKADWPLDTQLRYLFGGRAAATGFPPPERALRELLRELLAHDVAVGVAARAVVEGTLAEFAPAALKARLLGEGTKLFEAARAWDAYARHYAQQGEKMPEWVQRMLDKYFTAAYLRESLRIKRETPARQR